MKNVPEIRFVDTIYEKVKIKDIADINPRCELPSVFYYIDLEAVVGNQIVSYRKVNKCQAPSRAQRLAYEGDIFYQMVRPYQKNNFFFNKKYCDYVFSSGYAQVRAKKNNEFLFVYFHTDVFTKQVLINCTGTSYPAINAENFAKLNIMMPKDISESQKISSYVFEINKCINNTIKKIASLKQLKSACLISMFPQQGETVPRVRFKGFDGEWKKVKLSNCLEISKDINSVNVYGKEDVLSVSDEMGVMNQIKLLGRSYAGKSVSKYKILKPHQIVYTKSPLKDKPYGIIKENCGETGIVSVLYAVFNTKENVDPTYIHYYFEPKFRINKYLYPLVNKGAKNTMNISDDTTLDGFVYIPSSEAEQHQIASYFRNLDIQISEQEKRLEKLKQIKAACLDKMFV